jgi:hypothetical protein
MVGGINSETYFKSQLNLEKVIRVAEKDLASLSNSNYEQLRAVYHKVKGKFERCIKMRRDHPDFKDKKLYKPERIRDYGPEFLSYVDPGFVQDMETHREWYEENINHFLMNINYPCKLQTDFLKELELSQQKRNDQKYRKILDHMDKLENIALDPANYEHAKAQKEELESGI